MNSECYFRELGAHSEQSGYPHPEDCSRTANGDSAGYACDVTRSDGRCKCRTQRLERGDSSLSCGVLVEDLAEGLFHREPELADLDETGPDAQVEAYSEDAYHCRHAPNEIVDGRVDTSNCFHFSLLTYLRKHTMKRGTSAGKICC